MRNLTPIDLAVIVSKWDVMVCMFKNGCPKEYSQDLFQSITLGGVSELRDETNVFGMSYTDYQFEKNTKFVQMFG